MLHSRLPKAFKALLLQLRAAPRARMPRREGLAPIARGLQAVPRGQVEVTFLRSFNSAGLELQLHSSTSKSGTRRKKAISL